MFTKIDNIDVVDMWFEQDSATHLMKHFGTKSLIYLTFREMEQLIYNLKDHSN